jgi:hypothetical protein
VPERIRAKLSQVAPKAIEEKERASFVQPVQPGFNILAAIQGLLAKAAGNDNLRGIKGYKIIRELGLGACGTVYLAQGNSGKMVALKV